MSGIPSAPISRTRDKSKFARWGDGLDYHIGDLSHVLFGWQAYREPQSKYAKWAEMLFLERNPPRLRERVNLILVPWYATSVGPSGRTLTLEEAEEEVIGIACAEFRETLLNVQGETWRRPESSPEVIAPLKTHEKPLRWIKDDASLRCLVDDLLRCEFIGLDVETTLYDQRLCLIQIATEQFVAIIDPLAVRDLSPLAPVFSSPTIIKIIHNSSFERRILKTVGLELDGVFDTLRESRRVRGKLDGGHSLEVVARRELNVEMDKSCQISDWRRRPLSPAQVAYAALDADVLINLYKVFRSLGTERML